MKSLVVFYSRTGRTRRLARAIALSCGADIAEILDAKSRSGLLAGWWRSIRESHSKQETPIIAPQVDLGYDLVILGSPVWAGSMSSPVRTWLDLHRSGLTQIAVFVTQGGRGGDKAVAEIAELCQLVPVARLLLSARDFKSPRCERAVAEFVEDLRGEMESGPEAPTSLRSSPGWASVPSSSVRPATRPGHRSVSDHQGLIGW